MSIEVSNVVYSYRDGTKALNGVSFSIPKGSRVAIIGQNGAGKTTIAKLMNGLLKPTSGSVTVDGVNTAEVTTAETARNVSYIFQNPDDQLFKNVVYEEVEYLAKVLDLDFEDIDAEVRAMAELVGITKYLDANPKDLPLAVRKFVAIGSLLMARAPYLILDEPTAGLDVPGSERLLRVMDFATSHGAGIVTICHDMRFVIEHFETVIAMAHGQVVAVGTPEEIFSQDQVLELCAIQRPEATQLAADLGLPHEAVHLDDIRTQLQPLLADLN